MVFIFPVFAELWLWWLLDWGWWEQGLLCCNSQLWSLQRWLSLGLYQSRQLTTVGVRQPQSQPMQLCQSTRSWVRSTWFSYNYFWWQWLLPALLFLAPPVWSFWQQTCLLMFSYQLCHLTGSASVPSFILRVSNLLFLFYFFFFFTFSAQSMKDLSSGCDTGGK